ncbi:MAG: CoA transferase [Pseudolabrys sp.]
MTPRIGSRPSPAANVPCGPINTYSQILNDPQVAHMGWVRDLVLPNGAETKTFICPVLLSGKTIELRSPPPKLGQHRDEIISWLRGAAAREQVGAAE